MSASLDSGRPDLSHAGLTRVKLLVLAGAVVLLLISLLWLGVGPRRQANQNVKENLQVLGQSAPQVSLVRARPEKSAHQLTLPASLEAIQAIKIQARVDGYIGQWLVDIGDRVHQGQLLARIEVLASIPLALLSALVMLRLGGNTLNIMTLGGLSLAIGILVDDATVTIENIHRNAALGKGFVQSILDGARQIASPAFTVMMCICIVFASVTLLDGASYYLFVPFALSVVFSVFMSFVLSRTLVPVLVYRFLEKDLQHGEDPDSGLIAAVHHRFNILFERFRAAYSSLLWACTIHGWYSVSPASSYWGRWACFISSDATSSPPWTPDSSACM